MLYSIIPSFMDRPPFIIMLFLLAATLTLFSGLLVASALGVRGKSAYLLAIYLLSAGVIVISFEVLGLVRMLNQPLLFLGVQTLIALGCAAFWLRRGRPALLGPFSLDLQRLDFSGAGASMRRHPLLWLMALGVDVAYAVNAYVILVVPPNNNDSLYLHMARVARWLQTGSFLPYPTLFTWQLYFPLNAQALIYWTVLFWGTDQLAGFVQFGAALVTMLGVFGVARLLGFKRSQAVFAALLWASFPQVLFQSTTTQNDLVPAAMAVAAVYFLVSGLRGAALQPSLFLATLGISLALGAKQTAFFLLPGLAVAIFWLGWARRKELARPLLRWLPAVGLLFGCFGALVYVMNAAVYQNPLGDPVNLQALIHNPLAGADEREAAQDSQAVTPLTSLWINLNRIAYQFVDTTGLPPLLEGYLFRGKAQASRVLYQSLDLPLESAVAANPRSLVRFDFYHRPPLQEDETWFGIFAPFLLVPAGMVQLAHSFRRRNALPAVLWLLAGSFVLVELTLRPGWDAYLGRNFILAVVFLAPFAAAVYRPGVGWGVLVGVVVALSIYSLVTLTLNNASKPLIGPRAIWTLSRAQKLTLQNFYMTEGAQFVERFEPEDSVLALPPGTWEYPFYDDHLRRTLVLMESNDSLQDADWMRQQHIQYVLVRNDHPPAQVALPIECIQAGQSWSLYRVLP